MDRVAAFVDGCDALVVLGGGVYYESGRFLPTEYRHSDAYGMLGGHARVAAALEVCRLRPDLTVVFSTGVSEKYRSQFGTDVPSGAAVYAVALLETAVAAGQMQVPELLFETVSENTAGNLREVARLAARRGWNLAAIITSEFHTPRVEALWKIVNPDADTSVVVISAEAVLLAACPEHWEPEIRAAYATPAAARRLACEHNGLQDIESGRYELGEFQLTARGHEI